MSNENELLPCPLCNEPMVLEQFVDWEEHPLPVKHIVHRDHPTCPLARIQTEATPEAIAAWNRRAEPAPSSPVPVEAPNAGLIRVRNETGRFTEFINEDVPTVVRDIHPGVDVLLDLDTRKVVGFRVYDLTDFDALAEAWCRLAGKAIDALDAIESWDADGFDRYEVVAPIAEFAGKAVAEIRAAYPKQEPALPAAPAHVEVGE